MFSMMIIRYSIVNPYTFNDDTNVALFDSVVNQYTFNDYNNVALLLNNVNPQTFNDDNKKTLLLNNVNPVTFNDDNNERFLRSLLIPRLKAIAATPAGAPPLASSFILSIAKSWIANLPDR